MQTCVSLCRHDVTLTVGISLLPAQRLRAVQPLINRVIGS